MRTWILAAAIVMLVAPAQDAAARIYKWVDEEGNVQYTQKPPPDRPSETVDVATSGPSTAPEDEQEGEQSADAEPGEAEQAPAPEQLAMEQEEQIRQNCEIARNNLKLLESGVRVQTRDEAGNPVILDDEAREEELAEARKQVQTFCE